MLLKHFLKFFENAPEWARINVRDVERYGLNFTVITEDEIEYAQEQINSLKDDIARSEREISALEINLTEARDEVKKLEELVSSQGILLKSYKISSTDTIGDLVSRNEWQAEQLKDYKQLVSNFRIANEAFAKENTELRARKNKASVKRCLTTGKLMAEFQGKSYILTEKTN